MSSQLLFGLSEPSASIDRRDSLDSNITRFNPDNCAQSLYKKCIEAGIDIDVSKLQFRHAPESMRFGLDPASNTTVKSELLFGLPISPAQKQHHPSV
jgi:hypothetical protein